MNLPNKLTVIRIIMIPFFMLFAEWGALRDTYTILGSEMNLPLLMAAIIFAVASYTDWLDGHIARRDNIVTNFGKFADPLADKMLVAAALIQLAGIGTAPGWVVSLIIMRELAVTGLRLLLVQTGEVMAAQWPGKVKTFTQMIAIVLLLIGDFPFAFLPFSLGRVILYIALIFTLYSGIDYFAKNTHVFKDGL